MSSSAPFPSHEAPKAHAETHSPISNARGGHPTDSVITIHRIARPITQVQIQWNHHPAPAKVVRVDARTLELRRGRRAIGRIVGDRARLDLLERILDGKSDELLAETRLPKDAAAFAPSIEKRRQLVQGLLDDGRDLVERVERLACAIYDVPDDLTEQIVAHAVRRSS